MKTCHRTFIAALPALVAAQSETPGQDPQYSFLPVRARGGVEIVEGLAFVPEVNVGGDEWTEVCGHYFWNSHDGADTICNDLGFGYGRLSEERWRTHDWTGPTLRTRGLMIGACHEGEPLPQCSAGGNSFDFCPKGAAAGITVRCSDSPPLHRCFDACLAAWGALPQSCEAFTDILQPEACANGCGHDVIAEQSSVRGCDFDIASARGRRPDSFEVRAADGAAVVQGVGFVPEVSPAGTDSWSEICGHWFWNNHAGAAAVCRVLGFPSGRLQEERWNRVPRDWSGPVLGTDALWIGQCGAGEPLESCSGNQNRYEYLCKAGSRAGIVVICSEEPDSDPEQPECLRDCEAAPETCDEALFMALPGGCANDCDVYTLQPYADAAECDFDVAAALAGSGPGGINACLQDCAALPQTCDEAMRALAPGGCANDCHVDAVKPVYDALGCHFSFEDIINGSADDLGARYAARNLRRSAKPLLGIKSKW